MAFVSLDDICNKITGYTNVLDQHGFVWKTGGGVKAWSTRHTKGDIHVDVRSSEWTMYKGDEEVAVGRTPSELESFLVDYEVYTSFNFA